MIRFNAFDNVCFTVYDGAKINIFFKYKVGCIKLFSSQAWTLARR